ncbi:MAG: hypothetical protein ABIQ73_15380 [Acidimicrobiales bacterium]
MGVITPMNAMLRTPAVRAPAVAMPDDALAHDKVIAFLGRNL